MFRTVTVYTGEKISLDGGWMAGSGEKMRLRNALDRYVSSLTSAVTNLSPGKLIIPEIIRTDVYCDEDD